MIGIKAHDLSFYLIRFYFIKLFKIQWAVFKYNLNVNGTLGESFAISLKVTLFYMCVNLTYLQYVYHCNVEV